MNSDEGLKNNELTIHYVFHLRQMPNLTIDEHTNCLFDPEMRKKLNSN